MHTKTPALLVVTLACLVVSGCTALRRSAKEEKHWWQWEAAKVPASTSLSDAYKGQATGIRRSSPGEHLGLRFDHPKVTDFVSKFQTDLRGFYGRALERSGRYLPRIESILRQEGVPTELAYLPLVESGFRTHAVSPARAVGLWQFIPDTGRRYGLRIDSFVDERRDPIKSTRAAARYLKDLYGMFNDWHLCLAAYNTGEGRISRLLSASDAEDFWQLSERGYLFRETQDYVPGFLAALQIASQPEAYGFEPPRKESLMYDVLHIAHPMPLATIAAWSHTSLQELKELNPALIRDVVPPGGYTVRIPDGTRPQVERTYTSLTDRELAALKRAALPPAPPRRCTRRGKRVLCRPPSAVARGNNGPAKPQPKSRVARPGQVTQVAATRPVAPATQAKKSQKTQTSRTRSRRSTQKRGKSR